jgi:hypothetical protein
MSMQTCAEGKALRPHVSFRAESQNPGDGGNSETTTVILAQQRGEASSHPKRDASIHVNV